MSSLVCSRAKDHLSLLQVKTFSKSHCSRSALAKQRNASSPQTYPKQDLQHTKCLSAHPSKSKEVAAPENVPKDPERFKRYEPSTAGEKHQMAPYRGATRGLHKYYIKVRASTNFKGTAENIFF